MLQVARCTLGNTVEQAFYCIAAATMGDQVIRHLSGEPHQKGAAGQPGRPFAPFYVPVRLGMVAEMLIEKSSEAAIVPIQAKFEKHGIKIANGGGQSWHGKVRFEGVPLCG